MKKYFIFIFALMASAFSLMKCEGTVYGEENRFYVSGFGGVNFFDFHWHQGYSAKFHPGYVGAFAVGYKMPIFRTEIELAYRGNELKEVKFQGKKQHLRGDVNAFSVMANGYIDFHNRYNITPYIGLGIGYINTKEHLKLKDANSYGVEKLSSESTGLAYQGIVGVSVPVTAICKNMEIGVEYRYFGARKQVTEQNVGITARYIF